MKLQDIIRNKRIQLEKSMLCFSIENMKYVLQHLPIYPIRDIKGMFLSNGDMVVIGEFDNRKSAFTDATQEDAGWEELVRFYEGIGVQALSVLTETNYHSGESESLSVLRKTSDLPIIQKDFIIDPWQIYQAKMLGADAIFLIAAIVSPKELVKLYTIAKILGMSCLVEVHYKQELTMALEMDAEIISIGNYVFEDFPLEFEQLENLMTCIPKEKIIVTGGKNFPILKSLEYLMELEVNGVVLDQQTLKSVKLKDKLLLPNEKSA